MVNESDRIAFVQDVRRSIVLGKFIAEWGLPDRRRVTRKADDVVEVYSFPATGDQLVHRLASVGASGVLRQDGKPAGFELLMVLPMDFGGATFEDVTAFMFDVFAHGLRSDVFYRTGYAIPPTPRAPVQWSARAVLLDEPTGEPEELSTFHIGTEHVNLLWLIPIYGNEFELIQRDGADAFFALVDQSEWSIADPNRPPLINLSGVAKLEKD